jgi:hypothetical protein
MNKPDSYETFTFLRPWVPVREHADNLVVELQREILQSHPLYGKNLRAIAQRTDCDDVLFDVDSDDFAYAVVHLTWTGEPEKASCWPDTQVFVSWPDWIEKRMKPDNTNATT